MVERMKDSGIDGIGLIPKNWDESRRIKDIFTLSKGLSITKENLIDEGLPVISYGQVHSKDNTGTYINESLIRFVDYKYRKDKGSLVTKGDFIFADTSEDLDGCGNCVYVNRTDEMFAGYHTIIFQSEVSDNRYLAYLFTTDAWRTQIRKNVYAVKVYTVSQKILKECKIILPPKSEQQAISDFLDKRCAQIDDVIDDLEKQIEILKKYKKSTILKAVTKGIKQNIKYKDSGVEGIGLIPENWDESRRIKDIFTLSKGLSITKENLIDEGLPVISYGQVHSKDNTGTYIKDSLIRFVDYKYRKAKASMVTRGDFIFADTSEDLDGCGNCIYVNRADEMFAGYHTIIFQSEVSDNRYLAYLFTTDAWRTQIRKNVYAVKVYTVSQKILKECKIILPPQSEQQSIADFLDKRCTQIDDVIQNKLEQVIVMKKNKKSLIYEYVTGKKRVKEAN